MKRIFILVLLIGAVIPGVRAQKIVAGSLSGLIKAEGLNMEFQYNEYKFERPAKKNYIEPKFAHMIAEYTQWPISVENRMPYTMVVETKKLDIGDKGRMGEATLNMEINIYKAADTQHKTSLCKIELKDIQAGKGYTVENERLGEIYEKAGKLLGKLMRSECKR